MHADHVVLALPFTKLREVELHGIDLPPRQLRAIREEPLGANAKIQLQFSRRVWNADRLDREPVHRRHRPGRLGDDRSTSPGRRAS